MDTFGITCARVALGFVLAAASLPAQKTLVVGQGQQYTALQPAIDAAKDGDRVIVYDGTYSNSAERYNVTKAITITCRSRVRIYGKVAFTGIPAGRSAVLSGAEVKAIGRYSNMTAIEVTSAKGSVCIHACRLTTSPNTVGKYDWSYSSPSLVKVTHANVVLAGCAIQTAWGSPTIEVQDSTLSISDCGTIPSSASFMTGPIVGFVPGPTAPALRAVGSFVRIDRTNLTGAGAIGSNHPQSSAAIEASSASALVLAGEGSVIGGESTQTFLTHGGPAIDNNGGTVEVDRIVLQGGKGTNGGNSAPAVRGPGPVAVSLPALTGPSAPLAGTNASFSVRTRPSTVVVFLVSLAVSEPVTVPGIAGRYAFLGQPVVVPLATTSDASGDAALALVVPRVPGLGFQVQALAITPVPALSAVACATVGG